MRKRSLFALVALAFAAPLVGGPAAAADRRGPAALPTTIDDFLTLPGTTAIAHRGYGDNLGEDPARPIENTVPAVRRAFREGAVIVEVDVVLTADGAVVALHDDFLADFTCVNTLTLDALVARLPSVTGLPAILEQAKLANRSHPDRVTGVVVVEMKPASPRCDPGDVEDGRIASAVVGVVRRAGMDGQVLLDSFSPALLSLAAAEAPGLARQLTIAGMQFLTAEELEAITGLPVRRIDKGPLGFGLQWAELGLLYRLPGYASPGQSLGVALALGARSLAMDLAFLAAVEQVQAGAGAAFIGALHAYGLRAAPYTVTNAAEWAFAAALGANAVYTNDVALGLALQTAPVVRDTGAAASGPRRR